VKSFLYWKDLLSEATAAAAAVSLAVKT